MIFAEITKNKLTKNNQEIYQNMAEQELHFIGRKSNTKLNEML